MDECTKRMKFCEPRKLNIAFTRIANPYGHPNILAELIAGYRIQFHFAKKWKKAIEWINWTGGKGIQVLIARRRDGKEIPRVEWIRERRKGYSTKHSSSNWLIIVAIQFETVYVVLGIKIRIFVDEQKPLLNLCLPFSQWSTKKWQRRKLLCLVCDSWGFLRLGFKPKIRISPYRI